MKTSTTKHTCYQLRNICYSYAATPALSDINLDVTPGRFYGLVGPNGCGKTTLLDLLVGSKAAAAGTVRFNNRPLGDYRKRDLARLVSLVPQDFAIGFAFTVEEVVLMGRHPYIPRFAAPSATDWQLVDDAMTTIGIDHFGKRYVNELSGGEKQRVAVARALAQDTPVLLLDEATASLDVQYTLQIFNVVKKLVEDEGRTVIAVIHNLNLAAAYCDEILFMKEGRLMRQGSVGEVLEPGIISEVFGVESAVKFDPFSQTNQISFKYWK